MISDKLQLHPLAKKLLYCLGDAELIESDCISYEQLSSNLTLGQGQYNQAQTALLTAGLIREAQRIPWIFYECTEYGRSMLEGGGLAELRILGVLEQKTHTMAELGDATGLPREELGPAFGRLRKLNAVQIDANNDITPGDADAISLIRNLPTYLQAGRVVHAELSSTEQDFLALFAKKRGAANMYFRFVEREEIQYTLTEQGRQAAKQQREGGNPTEEITQLRPEMLRDSSWKDKQFRPYNVHLPPVRILIGRRNPYTEYLDEVRDKLVALGFEEFDGPLVETDFWNSDALFMPQFHSARDTHDVYYLREPQFATDMPEPYFSNVAAVHEHGGDTGSRGWMYNFDSNFAKRLILRSQGTVMSAKTLPHAKVPGKYFGILRCFRHDQVDATHLADFYQVEGIILGKDVNLRTLLGMLEIFAREFADAKEVRFVPGYFPFTEPSVEVHIKHPVLGWFELGGSGIFRPEVTRPLGVDVPVLAWGLGIDRMALMRLGLNDLRDLFTGDIDRVRNQKNNKGTDRAEN